MGNCFSCYDCIYDSDETINKTITDSNGIMYDTLVCSRCYRENHSASSCKEKVNRTRSYIYHKCRKCGVIHNGKCDNGDLYEKILNF